MKKDKKQINIKVVIIITVVFFVVLLMLFKISDSALVDTDFGDVHSDISNKKERAEKEDNSTGYDEVTETPETNTYYYAEIEKESNQQYDFSIENESYLTDANYSPEQINSCKKLINDYMERNPSNVYNKTIRAEEPTVYNQDGYFGVVFCLNEQDDIFVEIKCDSEKISFTEKEYTAPSVQNENDLTSELKEHEDYSILYKKTYPMDAEEFPFPVDTVNAFVEKYYSDLSTQNLYQDYVQYYLPMAKYMQVEWDTFSSDFSTFKNDVEQLKKHIANGDSELEQNGRLSAKVTAYRQFSRTLLVAKVAVTLTSKSGKNSMYQYVTLGYDDNLFLLPHDMFTVNYWRFLYRY